MWANSIIDFNRAIELNQDPEYYFKRALAKHNLKQYKDALLDFDFAINLDPNNNEFKRSKEKTIDKLSEIDRKVKEAEKAKEEKAKAEKARQKKEGRKREGRKSEGRKSEGRKSEGG